MYGAEASRHTTFERSEKKDPRSSLDDRGSRKTAATYSPNWWVSTIGAGELNCSVRNGKRWNLTAITTAICYLREKTIRRTFRFFGSAYSSFAFPWLYFL